MVNLTQSLGLENVEADPNAIPDGSYDGVVSDSKYVLLKAKDQVAHVVTFQVTDGTERSKTIAKFNTLGSGPRNADGQFPGSVEDIASYTPTMSDSQKSWYKSMFVDLGVPEEAIPTTPISALVGINVTFGVKQKDGYRNVNYQRLRTEQPPASMGPVAVGTPATPAPAAQAQPQDLGGLV